MAKRWKISAAPTASGNVLTDWIRRDAQLQARVDSHFRRMCVMPYPWPVTFYRPLGEGIGEVRIDFRKVEYRLYGYLEFGCFRVISVGGKKGQEGQIKAAKKLKRQYGIAAPKWEDYDV